MKSIILTKQYPSIQLAHLYEHLFMRALHDFFYSKHLFKSIDYAAHGTTFEAGGIITVEVELYSQKAIDSVTTLEQTKVQLGAENKHVTRALMQMSAEEQYELRITDSKELIEDLQLLDSQPWLNFDEVNYTNGLTVRRKRAPIYLTHEPQQKPRALRLEFTVNKLLDASLAPLFNTVSRAVSFTVADKIALAFGYYTSDLSGKALPLSVTNSIDVPSMLTKHVDLDSIEELARATTIYMLSADTIERLNEDLLSVDYSNAAHLAPNIERIITETGVLMGSSGWRSYSTKHSIHKVIEATTLTIRFGRQTRTIHFRDLFLSK